LMIVIQIQNLIKMVRSIQPVLKSGPVRYAELLNLVSLERKVKIKLSVLRSAHNNNSSAGMSVQNLHLEVLWTHLTASGLCLKKDAKVLNAAKNAH
jgi:hypothetical protein